METELMSVRSRLTLTAHYPPPLLYYFHAKAAGLRKVRSF
jgi:hypothetical protein